MGPTEWVPPNGSHRMGPTEWVGIFSFFSQYVRDFLSDLSLAAIKATMDWTCHTHTGYHPHHGSCALMGNQIGRANSTTVMYVAL